MAVTNSIKTVAIGYGNPMFYVAATTVAATNTQTNTLTASLNTNYTSFTGVGTTHGKWRLRVMPLTTATTVSSVVIVASNGTTTENVYASSGNSGFPTNSRNINLIGEYITDLSPGYTNLTCTVTFGAAATGTIDFEFFGNP